MKRYSYILIGVNRNSQNTLFLAHDICVALLRKFVNVSVYLDMRRREHFLNTLATSWFMLLLDCITRKLAFKRADCV